MTWSIIARDELSGQFGIAVATRFFAVGARVPHIAPHIGAIATQALVNPYYGIDGLKLLRERRQPRDVVQTVIAVDPGRESRQLHILDASGRIASHTGRDCIEWCGHIEREGISVAGNMLAGPEVLEDTAQAYIAAAKLPLPQRLIAAMRSGEAAGGDKRGKQSAAVSSTPTRNGRRLICASTTTPIRLRSWSALKRSAAKHGWISGVSFPPARILPE